LSFRRADIGGRRLDKHADRFIAVVLAIVGSIVYLLTMEPTVSFWDCGEFIATSYGLQVGHPPGAPTYNLLAHCVVLLACGNAMLVAPLSNALSAVAAGATVGLLYSTILMLAEPQEGGPRAATRWAALVGSLCYMFCDTAWFSATESEVYSLATCMAALMLWAALKWYRSVDPRYNRWLLLIALVAGLGVGVHQLTLLVLPSVALIVIFALRRLPRKRSGKRIAGLVCLTLLFFAMGLSTYAIVPIRAAAKPQICYGDPSTAKGFKKYMNRDQYAKAPLWPRSWRKDASNADHYAVWQGKGGDVELMVSYQFGYMYIRYLLWNFSGRFNDRQGFGGMQNGQFITGLPLIDDLLVGSSATPPQDMAGSAHNRYLALPLLLGIFGAIYQCRQRRRGFFVTLALFLMGGIVLGGYMNHPVYEPRERDYAYILSFYAYAVWIAFGAKWVVEAIQKLKSRKLKKPAVLAAYLLVAAVPTLMACQNWDDHSRHGRYTAHDTAANMLNSCDQDAILITYGDNDTFPLWYAQQVEGIRPDVTVANVNLKGGWRWLTPTLNANSFKRPVFFSRYMRDYYGEHFQGRLQLTGLCYRLCPTPCDSIDCEAFCRHALNDISWHDATAVHIDPISRQFIESYWRSVEQVAKQLVQEGERAQAIQLIAATDEQLPIAIIADKTILRDIARFYHAAGCGDKYEETMRILKGKIADDERYYKSIRPHLRHYAEQYYLLPSDFWND